MFTLGIHRCIVLRAISGDSKQPCKSTYSSPHHCLLTRDDERALSRIRVSRLNVRLVNLI